MFASTYGLCRPLFRIIAPWDFIGKCFYVWALWAAFGNVNAPSCVGPSRSTRERGVSDDLVGGVDRHRPRLSDRKGYADILLAFRPRPSYRCLLGKKEACDFHWTWLCLGTAQPFLVFFGQTLRNKEDYAGMWNFTFLLVRFNQKILDLRW